MSQARPKSQAQPAPQPVPQVVPRHHAAVLATALVAVGLWGATPLVTKLAVAGSSKS